MYCRTHMCEVISDPFQESPYLFHLWHANWISVSMQMYWQGWLPSTPSCCLPPPSILPTHLSFCITSLLAAVTFLFLFFPPPWISYVSLSPPFSQSSFLFCFYVIVSSLPPFIFSFLHLISVLLRSYLVQPSPIAANVWSWMQGLGHDWFFRVECSGVLFICIFSIGFFSTWFVFYVWESMPCLSVIGCRPCESARICSFWNLTGWLSSYTCSFVFLFLFFGVYSQAVDANINNGTVILPLLPLSLTVCFWKGTAVGHIFCSKVSLSLSVRHSGEDDARWGLHKAPPIEREKITTVTQLWIVLLHWSWSERETQICSYILVNAVLHQISQFCWLSAC